jgi:adenosylcobinamide-phosphate synthase
VSTAALLLVALVLDALLGEPDSLWQRLSHPAVLMGRTVGWCETRFNRGPARKVRGVTVMACLVLGAGALGVGLAALPLGPLIEIVLAAILLAQKSLVQHVAAVADGLRQSEGEGRRMVARIVGRDTAGMDGPAISRAAIESAAENFSDGVVAPALWFLVGGLPGILIYKIVNTADSMIGYRTPPLREFGWAAARLDDVLNWIPARLTALILFAAFRRWPDWRALRRDAALHRSPNAGWPEAAMATGLDVALAGPRSYDGTVQDFPWVWPDGNRHPGPPDIDRATDALWRGWCVLGAATVVMVGLL